MDYFQYRDNELYCEEVPVRQIIEQNGSPAYIYSAGRFRRQYQALAEAFDELQPLICYSVKGCSNINICRLLAEAGSGFDVVSGGELFRALQAGGQAGNIVYAGVGKTDGEIRQAIEAGIGYFNIESEAELEVLANLAAEMNHVVQAALRINPDIDPHTHRHTSTGKKQTKFGVDLDRAMEVFSAWGHSPNVKLCGIHIHIGSPINSTEPYVLAIGKTLAFIEELRNQGYEITMLDIGGGFGNDYVAGESPTFADYAGAIMPLLRGKGLKLVLEPGRSISANAGILVTQVLYTKKGGKKNFTIVDAAMNDLIRPMLYDAFHFIWPVQVANGFSIDHFTDPVELAGTVKMDVVGPICETGDYFARDRYLPPMQRGDLLSIFSTGAYGFSMSSQYNSRPRVAEFLVDGSDFKLIRKRETYEDLINLEKNM